MNARCAGRLLGRGVALLALCAAMLFARPAGADLGVQFSASIGLGPFSAGAGPLRFAVVPTASFLLLGGENWFLRCDDAVTLLGATGGRFGVANTTTLSFGARWKVVNISVGPSLAEYSLPLCGASWCSTVRGLAPGVDARLDAFLPELLRSALGLSASCGTIWMIGVASSGWSGFSTQCTLGPIFRLSSR
jgi:hypothetical protein